MQVRLALSLAILLAGPAVAQKKPPAPPPPADTVRLRFGWPVGLTARVNAHKFRARSADGKADTTNVRLAYRFTVQPHRQGRLLRFHGFEVPGVGVVEEVEDRVAALMPSVIVDTTGAFVAIEGVEAMRRELDTFLGLESFLYYDQDAMRAVLDRLMAQMTLPDTAQQPVIENYELETEMRLIAEPGTLIPYRLAVTKQITMSLRLGKGRATETTQVETKTTSYEYIAR